MAVLAVMGVAAALAGIGAQREAATAAETMSFTPLQQRLLSGVATAALAPATPAPLRSAQRERAAGGGGDVCPPRRAGNVRVNQECQNVADPDLPGRSQAQNEPAIAHDPNRPSRLVASSNDYRRGDLNCYAYASSDGGRTWSDSTAPMSFTRGTRFGDFARQYWQAGGDTSVAWDTKGNAYLSCFMFNRGSAVSQNPDASSAFYVFRSTGSGGRTWNFPARPVAEADDGAGEGALFLDKQYMAVDARAGSPYQDRVYVTWTAFAADGTAYIYGAHSSDYAETFSEPRLISGDSALCSHDVGVPTPQGRCSLNQFSQPFTGPDGALYVVFDNYNMTAPGEGADNRNQVLLVKSTDGGQSFGAPVKVADYHELPDCAAYQDGASPGVACVPEKGDTANSIFRAANYPSGAVNPRDPDEVVVTFASYLNVHSNEDNGCVPAGYDASTFLARYEGVKTPGACNNDILVSRSSDGGETFTGGSTDVRELPAVRADDPRFADQFFQWAAFDARGRLAVTFYDRHYGDDQVTGYSDVSLFGARRDGGWRGVRVTSASMPPASQFSGGFFGDYIGLTIGGRAHPIWVDSRDPGLTTCRDGAGNVTLPPAVCVAEAPNAPTANDQNLYTQGLPVP